MRAVDEIRYVLFDRHGIKVDETTSKRKLKKWLKDGAKVIRLRVVKHPSLGDLGTFVVVELENSKLSSWSEFDAVRD